MNRTRTLRTSLGLTSLVVVALLSLVLAPPDAAALIFASPGSEPTSEIPDDFPYWEHISQRRYGGPTVIYLGAGWVLTARHVGFGEVILGGKNYLPNLSSPRTLMNENGSAADIMVFQLAVDADFPDLPLLPLAKSPPLAGEEVLMIGFGRGRKKVIEWNDAGETRYGFEWTQSGSKRWGTNRIVSNHETLIQAGRTTRILALAFDPPFSALVTPFEAHAAVGDSGGAVLIRRNGTWELTGMMTSISVLPATPGQTSQYGDTTYAADISFYRSEIFRWTRARCANEEDDDGDGKIDFPLDPDCDSFADRDERTPPTNTPALLGLLFVIGLAGIGLIRWTLSHSRHTD